MGNKRNYQEASKQVKKAGTVAAVRYRQIDRQSTSQGNKSRRLESFVQWNRIICNQSAIYNSMFVCQCQAPPGAPFSVFPLQRRCKCLSCQLAKNPQCWRRDVLAASHWSSFISVSPFASTTFILCKSGLKSECSWNSSNTSWNSFL
jgi:hypothetical protein